MTSKNGLCVKDDASWSEQITVSLAYRLFHSRRDAFKAIDSGQMPCTMITTAVPCRAGLAFGHEGAILARPGIYFNADGWPPMRHYIVAARRHI